MGIRGVEQNDMIGDSQLPFSKKDRDRRMDSNLSGQSMYIDMNISPELRDKVILLEASWFYSSNRLTLWR